MSFAIGVTQRGVAGGLLSGALFQYPGLVVMTALGALAAEYLVDPPGWLRGAAQGFGAAGVALVAGAFVGLSTKLCRGKLLGTVSALSAGAAFYAPQPWMFPTLIALGGIAAWVDAALVQKTPPPKDDGADESVRHLGLPWWGGLSLIVAWLGVLIGVIVGRAETEYEGNEPLHWFEAFYRTGSLIFGGGQVVLPLLLDEVTCDPNLAADGFESRSAAAADAAAYLVACALPPGSSPEAPWMSLDQFVAGLGLAQAMARERTRERTSLRPPDRPAVAPFVHPSNHPPRPPPSERSPAPCSTSPPTWEPSSPSTPVSPSSPARPSAGSASSGPACSSSLASCPSGAA